MEDPIVRACRGRSGKALAWPSQEKVEVKVKIYLVCVLKRERERVGMWELGMKWF